MRLLLVYNADDGFFNALTDTVHKIVSPATYECFLCYYTYGTFGMLRPWRDFLEGLGVPQVFYHRNEFRRAHPEVEAALPALFTERDGAVRVLVSAEEINACGSLKNLMALVEERLRGGQEAAWKRGEPEGDARRSGSPTGSELAP